jgi:hypothetical protein
MTARHLFLAAATAFCATAILGQTLPSMFPSKPPRIASGSPQSEVRLFRIGAKAYRVTLAHGEVFASPVWQPSMPLPIDFAKVEGIARAELRKLVSDDSRWEVTDLGLTRISQTLQPEWFYVVELRPKWDGITPPRDRFSEMVALSGKPGKIEPEGTP